MTAVIRYSGARGGGCPAAPKKNSDDESLLNAA
jgi:hypothetical protein